MPHRIVNRYIIPVLCAVAIISCRNGNAGSQFQIEDIALSEYAEYGGL